MPRMNGSLACAPDKACPAPVPGYLFINLDLETARWRAINGTVGVSHVSALGDTLGC